MEEGGWDDGVPHINIVIQPQSVTHPTLSETFHFKLNGQPLSDGNKPPAKGPLRENGMTRVVMKITGKKRCVQEHGR